MFKLITWPADHKGLTMRNLNLICLFVLTCLLSQIVLASQIYRVVDEQGRVSYSDQPSANSKQIEISIQTPNRQLHRVKSVYDGDTIILENGDSVRLLGVNTPEIEGRFRQDEPGGIAAKIWLKNELKDWHRESHKNHGRLEQYSNHRGTPPQLISAMPIWSLW